MKLRILCMFLLLPVAGFSTRKTAPGNGTGYSQVGQGTFQPGDTLDFAATTTPRTYFTLENVSGSATQPIVLMMKGKVEFRNGISLTSCNYLVIDGQSESGQQYGFYCFSPSSYGGTPLNIAGLSNNIKVFGFFAKHFSNGVWCKNELDCNHRNWLYPARITNIEIYNYSIDDVTNEGMYMFSTDSYGDTRYEVCGVGDTIRRPTGGANISVHDGIIINSQRQAYQISGADQGEQYFYNNYLYNIGNGIETNQGSGFFAGGATVNMHVYNNIIKKTFNFGLASYAEKFVDIHDNTIDSSGYCTRNGINYTLGSIPNIQLNTFSRNANYTTFKLCNNFVGKNTFSGGYNTVLYNNGNHYTSSGNIIGNSGKVYNPTNVPFGTNCGVVANRPPTCDAGNDSTIQNAVTTFQTQASAADPDGDALTYTWTGSGVTFSNSTILAPALSSITTGEHKLKLVVSDGKGGTCTDSMYLTRLDPVYLPPVARAGNDTTIQLPVTSVQLNFTQSYDPNTPALPLTYQIFGIEAPKTVTVSGSTTQPVISGLTLPGKYTGYLKVSNAYYSTNDTATITVLAAAPNQNPVANAGINQTVQLPTNTALLNGSGSYDPDGSIDSIAWYVVSGGASIDTQAIITSVSGLTLGENKFGLFVQDNQGATARDTITITVIAADSVENKKHGGKGQFRRILQNIFGVLPYDYFDIAGQVNVANQLHAGWQRYSVVLTNYTGFNYGLTYLITAGKKVVLNLNYNPSGGANPPSAYATDTAAYRTLVSNFLNDYGSQIDYVVVENEEDNSLFHSGTIEQYLQELFIAADECKKRNIPVTNGGLETRKITWYVGRWYYDNGLTAQGDDYISRTAPTSQNAIKTAGINANIDTAIARIGRIMNACYTLGIPINIHWYEPVILRGTGILNESIVSEDALVQTVSVLRQASNVQRFITNEIGTLNHSTSLVTEVMLAALQAGLQRVIWFSGETAETKALHNSDQTLNALGIAFKNYIINSF